MAAKATDGCPDHCSGIGIVDDEKELVNVLVKLFARRNVRVCFTAYDGLEAVELVKNSTLRPKVILMDNRLFSMSGIDAMKAILEVDREIRFVFLSADADAESDTMSAGATLFVKKPASTSDIMAAVNRALA